VSLREISPPVVPTIIVRRQVEIDFAPVPAGPWFPAGGPLEGMFNAASLSFPTTIVPCSRRGNRPVPEVDMSPEAFLEGVVLLRQHRQDEIEIRQDGRRCHGCSAL